MQQHYIHESSTHPPHHPYPGPHPVMAQHQQQSVYVHQPNVNNTSLNRPSSSNIVQHSPQQLHEQLHRQQSNQTQQPYSQQLPSNQNQQQQLELSRKRGYEEISKHPHPTQQPTPVGNSAAPGTPSSGGRNDPYKPVRKLSATYYNRGSNICMNTAPYHGPHVSIGLRTSSVVTQPTYVQRGITDPNRQYAAPHYPLPSTGHRQVEYQHEQRLA